MRDLETPAQWIRREVSAFTKSSANTMKKWHDEPAWGDPLVGFSSGADPLYAFYQEDIGAFYRLPADFLAHKYPHQGFDPANITVISWILPQTEATKRDHRLETHFPSERWARSRIYGEAFNNQLRAHLVAVFHHEGIAAVAPLLSPLWASATSLKYGYASTWSERHAAYVAGLGTFGLSDGLITPVGKAMRAGSVVAYLALPPTKRPYTNHHAYCLFHMKGTCGQCMERCPIGAITEAGHNKVLCRRYNQMTRHYVPRHYGFEGYGCGFCQTGVPCESGIPECLTP